MNTRNTVAALIAAVTLVGAGAAASAATNTLVLYQGAQIKGRMTTDVSTASAHVGDRFTADVVPPYPSGDPTFQGATLSGTVTSVRRAAQGTTPQLGVEFTYMRLANGTVVNISGSMTQATQKSNDTQHGLNTAIGAVGGMLIGNAIGKTIFHTGGGGAVGAIGGGLLGYNHRTNFTVPAGSDITVTLNQNVYVRRQSGH